VHWQTSSAVLLMSGLIFERLYPFLEYLVKPSGSIAQPVRVALVYHGLVESLYLCFIHSIPSLQGRI
jgi:hypothetical protein